eukprot:CAMPEP_0177736820 /NCGR_PEP_ID=MMETSP0484_2-20121128/25550_1 /TAXON_ID=354590 /ORGANISM="Rhodomonas lens, Strain RHODO" /LENGTH=163 /DNA_ID=CAMNT_0019250549 /DNA_START=163 /DNA_END=649 /DNA_ORIENTATION=+
MSVSVYVNDVLEDMGVRMPGAACEPLSSQLLSSQRPALGARLRNRRGTFLDESNGKKSISVHSVPGMHLLVFDLAAEGGHVLYWTEQPCGTQPPEKERGEGSPSGGHPGSCFSRLRSSLAGGRSLGSVAQAALDQGPHVCPLHVSDLWAGVVAEALLDEHVRV